MMDSGSFMHFASGFLAMLGASALRSIVLAGVAGVLLAIFCVKDVTLRLAVWKLALWSALAMPLLALVLPPVQFGFRIFHYSPRLADRRPCRIPLLPPGAIVYFA